MEQALVDFAEEERDDMNDVGLDGEVMVRSPKLLRGVPRDAWTKGKKLVDGSEPKFSQQAIQIPSFKKEEARYRELEQYEVDLMRKQLLL